MLYNIITQLPITEIANTAISISTMLIAVDIAIFVLAVTFLGEAIELAKKEKIKSEEKEIEEFSKRIDELKKRQKELDSHASEEELYKIRENIDKALGQRAYSEKKKKKIENKYGSLKFKNSVVYPTILFFLATFFCSFLIHITSDINIKLTVLFASILLLLAGGYNMAYVLTVIESIAIGSEERRWLKTKEAFKSSLEEHEKRKKPLPFLWFVTQEPLELEQNKEAEIEFKVTLKYEGGEYAENLSVMLFVSPEIELLHDKKTVQSSEFFIPNADSIRYEIGNIVKRVNYLRKVKIKSTEKTGAFVLRYSVYCKGHSEHPRDNPPFNIIVS